MSQNANQLRWVAEAADGIRDEECAIVWAGDKLEVVKLKDLAGRTALLAVRTDSTGGDQGGMRSRAPVTMTYNGKPVKLPQGTDAIFLSQSSVEKFVLPYYTRMQTPEWIAGKKAELFAGNIRLAAHTEPSITTGQSEPDEGPRVNGKIFPLEEDSDGTLKFNFNAL